MVDFASTQAQAKVVAPPASHEGGGVGCGHHSQAPECFTSAHSRRVDKMYYHWQRFTPSLPSN
jgi:hypothetical protein